MQCGSRAETFLSLVLTESSHDQRMAQSEEAQNQLAPWGFGVAFLQHLPLPLHFTCCHRQDKVENQLSGMQRMRDDEERGEGGKKQGKSTAGAYEVNRGKETVEEGMELLTRRRERQ